MGKRLSNLQVKLLDEYYRFERCLADEQEHLARYPRGSVQRKWIRGHLQYYLIWREGGKARSRYLRHDSIFQTMADVDRRRRIEESIRSIRADMKIIERALGKKMIESYRGR